MLRVVIGLDAKACGRILGRRAGAVRTAAHRGLRQLDRFFGRDIDRLLGRGAPEAR
jgi:RNA polymerase sigma-70 factor (ECF subfamily)